ncbi:MAG: (d)CMP kinase [bacterium]
MIARPDPITIDGPAGAGKSTIARIVAEKLGLTYIDTGAMYRAVTYKALKNKIDMTDPKKMCGIAAGSRIRFDKQKILLDGEDVSRKIRSRTVTNRTSITAASGEVRRILRDMQRQFAEKSGVVMEGRDIGTVVFPRARFKFYLDASISERAKRRFLELKEKGNPQILERIIADINKRDNIDKTRGLCPLKIPAGATVIDSTNKSIEEVADIIIKEVAEKSGKK